MCQACGAMLSRLGHTVLGSLEQSEWLKINYNKECVAM